MQTSFGGMGKLSIKLNKQKNILFWKVFLNKFSKFVHKTSIRSRLAVTFVRDHMVIDSKFSSAFYPSKPSRAQCPDTFCTQKKFACKTCLSFHGSNFMQVTSFVFGKVICDSFHIFIFL
jgi:hypothetical protein